MNLAALLTGWKRLGEMSRQRFCNSCGTREKFKPFESGLYKFGGERVLVCKSCGLLRTDNKLTVPEGEIVHMPSQKKKKERDKDL